MIVSPDTQTGQIVFFKNPVSRETFGTPIRISRHHVVFEFYRTDYIPRLSEVLSDLRIQQGGIEVYRGRAVVTRLLDTGVMYIVEASLLDNMPGE